MILGIDFGGTKVALATATAAGEVLHRERLATRAGDGAKEVVRRAVDAAGRLVAETPGTLTAAGVSTIGVVRGGRVRLAPNIPGWEELPLPDLLADGLGVPVRVDNDVNAATTAEARWGNLAGVATGIYVNLGTGLSAGLIVDGRVMPGTHGAAGEIGYLLRTPDEPAHAAGHAPLEEYASGSGLAARGSALLGTDVTATDLFARDDPAVAALLDETAGILAMTVANLATVLDPECVVIGGGMAAQPSILPAIRETVSRAVPFPPRVERARFLDDAALIGAIALVATSVMA